MKQRRARVLKIKLDGSCFRKCIAHCSVLPGEIGVGSIMCQKCEHNIITDLEKQKVLCAHPDLFKKKRGKK